MAVASSFFAPRFFSAPLSFPRLGRPSRSRAPNSRPRRPRRPDAGARRITAEASRWSEKEGGRRGEERRRNRLRESRYLILPSLAHPRQEINREGLAALSLRLRLRAHPYAYPSPRFSLSSSRPLLPTHAAPSFSPAVLFHSAGTRCPNFPNGLALVCHPLPPGPPVSDVSGRRSAGNLP